MTKVEAAEAMRCSPRTVQRRVATGKLACVRDSANRLLFLPEFIQAYFAENTVAPKPQSAKPRRNPKYQ